MPLINLFIYAKDQSQCMDFNVGGIKFLNYRLWNLLSFITLTLIVVFSFAESSLGVREKLKLNFGGDFCTALQGVVIALLIMSSIFLVVLNIVGLYIFLNLDFATCSNSMLTVSLLYFFMVVKFYTNIIILSIKKILTENNN